MNQSPTPAKQRFGYFMFFPLTFAMSYLSACNHEGASMTDTISNELKLSDEDVMTVSETMPMFAQCNQPDLDERSNCSN